MNEQNTAAVRTDDVWKIFEQEAEEVQAIRGVHLTIEPGEFTAMAGPSGSGKTTLLNLIGGLTRATRGNVWVAGRDLTAMSNRELAHMRLDQIGFIFQAYNLLPVLTAAENAEFPLLLQGANGGQRRERVHKLFERTGLAGLEDRRPGKLSGGQQQRVAVIRAVVSEPALVLADEPTANLDSAASDQLLDMMEELNRELGTTFVFATHDPRVMDRARRLVRLVDGAVASDERR
ncbi:MAG: ABC transporter ATP-binding protein [Gemmatimonadales bacterium]|jgi:putative ABC transport system ATP-binding protein